ncbi:MAG: hypothetical protein EOO01_22045, partial [Chitinophagaceae bacterium]
MIIAKKSLPSMGSLALLSLLTFLVISCGHENEGGVRIPLPKDTSDLAEINHFIPEGQINTFKAAFRSQRDSLARAFPGLYFPLSETFNKQALLD